MSTEVRSGARRTRHPRSRADAARYTSLLMDALQARIEALIIEDAPGLDESPEMVADRMVAALPRAPHYDDLVGPFFGTDAVRRMLGGISRQAVHERARADRRTLLQVQTVDRVSLYPAFQFDGDEVPARMRATISAFRNAPVDGWAIATWFSVPAQDLDGLTPRQWLADADRDPVPVRELALGTARRWAAP